MEVEVEDPEAEPGVAGAYVARIVQGALVARHRFGWSISLTLEAADPRDAVRRAAAFIRRLPGSVVGGRIKQVEVSLAELAPGPGLRLTA